MTGPHAGIVVGVLGQWASGKTEAASTLIRHLGGEGNVVSLSDRVLWISQLIKHMLDLDESEISVSVEEDGRRRLDSKLVTVWLRPDHFVK
jgi:dephospho-CoA kinase